MSASDDADVRDEGRPPVPASDDPNPRPTYGHDEDRDPLDIPVLPDHERLDDGAAAPVQDGRPDPPPAEAHD